MKPLIIYHGHCADGFGAAFAAWLKFGNDADYLPQVYTLKDSDPVSKLNISVTGRDVYILDFSFPRKHTDAIFKYANRVVWLDHHKSAFEMWCDNYHKGMRFGQSIDALRIEILLDDNKSGALLAWEYFHPDTVAPILFKHIDDYDRWQFQINSTKEFNKTLWSYTPWSFEQWSDWLEHLQNEDDGVDFLRNWYAEGSAILRAHNQNVQAVIKGSVQNCVITKHCGDAYDERNSLEVTGIAANCPKHLVSDVGHELAKLSGTFGLMWSVNRQGRCLCDLRSSGDYDVSAIAKAFDGGGHKNAAGFVVDIKTLLRWLR